MVMGSVVECMVGCELRYGPWSLVGICEVK